jgi:hypothetical protein
MPIAPPRWITDFVSFLSAEDPETRQRGFDLKAKNIPPRLYRYRNPNPREVEQLRSNEIWLSAACKFNDPFDSAVSVDFGPAMQAGLHDVVTTGALSAIPAEKLARVTNSVDMIAAFGELFADIMVEKVGEGKHQQVITFFQEFLAKQSADATQAFSQGWQRMLKIAAFTEISDSLVLWSHYAANHEGFCVEYDFEALSPADPRVQCLFPVVYVAKRFKLGDYLTKLRNGKEANPTLPILAAIHKSSDWAYEREWRLVQMDDGVLDGLLVPMPQPKTVRIGARMKPELRSKICQLAETAGFAVYEMRLSTTNFVLESMKIAG